MTEQNDLMTVLMKEYGLSESSAYSVISYAKDLAKPGRKENDIALAKALNEYVFQIIYTVDGAIDSHKVIDLPDDMATINKIYVLLINELKKIYARNPELNNIEQRPIWYHFDVIEESEHEIHEYIWDNSQEIGQQHNAQLNKLCIISGIDKPNIPPDITNLIESVKQSIKSFEIALKKEIDKDKDKDNDKEWHIPEYRLTYELDGLLRMSMTNMSQKTKQSLKNWTSVSPSSPITTRASL